ncbi:MAG: hypothetical protein QOF11_137 [Chloroflexota bacterium]|jgi:hypothetical protein|nr:hypothetical protein [Chloroflexota bacterium]
MTSDATEFVRFCYRRRRVGWPELYDEMCAVAGRGLYRGWRFAELEERGIGFSLHQTLELARIAAQVAVEEGDRRGRVDRSAQAEGTGADAGIPIVSSEPVAVAMDIRVEPVIEVRIVAATATSALATEPADVPTPIASSPSRPALGASLMRSAAGAS